MASTYSSLKIQLMATGENSGTWGNVTNVNLGTAIEEAIVGSADVTFASGTVTLTLTDANSSQTARNLRLNLTGTSGGAQNLIVPAIEKVYIVNNGCADTITVKNTGGTGIAVPAGKTMYVYNNGTNVVDAITHLTSLTLGTALPIASGGTGTNSTTYANLQSNVSGVLPVANGGTGSNSATFSGANITSLNATAVSSGTLDNARTSASSSNGASTIVARDGSGNFTANVITANGSALTSLNAANISSGTLAADRGGTGVNSTGTSGNVLTSNGTAWVSQAISAGGDYVMTAFTSSGTWTKPAGLKAVKVTVIGAGGNGGNSVGNPDVGVGSGGNGGGGGGAIEYLDAPAIPGPVTVTVGTAPSKTSSFGPFLSATGGTNGSNGSPPNGDAPTGPYAGGVGSGGTVNFNGEAGTGIAGGTSPSGGSALGFGPGVTKQDSGTGIAGLLYGGGATGGRITPAGPGSGNGGAGGAGIVIVEEFY
jgi:hypothetical protein